ncbi:MAG: putative lipid II flippase FtsW [Firmicutes bacterium]|nr:putative lipid II flippase FtsW [Bacillota bacterium]
MKKKFDTFMFLPILGLILYGIIMIFSASSPTAALSPMCNNDPYFFLKRHLIWLGIGFVAMYFAYKMDVNQWRKYAVPIMVLALFMLVLVMVPGLSREVLGARRYLYFGSQTFQPSEFAKIAMIFWLADALARRKENVRKFKTLLGIFAVVGVIVILIEKQPDLGTTIVIGGTFLGMLFLAGVKIWQLAAISVAGVAIAVSRILEESYRMARITAFLDPWKDSQGAGYQIIQSLIALGSGGLHGLGLGESRQKYFYLPEKFTDFIFAITGEELGFYFGTLPIIILFLVFLYKGLRISANAKDPFMCLLAGGVTFQIAFQAFVNMGVVSSMLPCTGIPLPFISFGGTSLVFTMFSIGFLMNVAGEPRRSVEAKDVDKVTKPRFGPRESGEIEIPSEKERDPGKIARLSCKLPSQEEAREATYIPQ